MSIPTQVFSVKTRTLRHADGRVEVLRVLSPEELDQWSEFDPTSYEKSVVWTEDVSRLPWVRVAWIKNARSRRGPLALQGGARVVGYGKLTHNAPKDLKTGGYTRRIFYLTQADAEAQGKANAAVPPGGLDPSTIFPGVEGRPPQRPIS